MKSIIIVVILGAAAICAPAADKKKDPPASQAVTIPKDAVPSPDGSTYRYTDKQGKKWIYVKTPFGVMKSPASDQPAAASPDLSSTKAIDKGDTVRFERPSPFGTVSWEKKKADLTDDERHILDAQPLDSQPRDSKNAKTEKND